MTSISQLNDQKLTVLRGIADTKNNISNVEDKITRLQQASSNLAKSISELETLKRSIDSLIIDTGKWKGEEKDKFEENYSSYKESVKKFVASTEDAKDAIDQDIKRYEAEKATWATGLNNLENELDSIDWKISQAGKE
ncbi:MULTISPECIES: YwqH-like family protein [unclassified Oceanobacillus]|uniref:YwqH-like family protein n=1 Tax=unclassified Oceanobacillus TaxID=2630292 RepID=UPI00300E0A0C